MRAFSFVTMAALLALFGCQTKPTKTSQSEERAFDFSKAAQPISITPTTIVVDARPAFDYSTAHVPHSVPLSWSDFTEAEPAQRGIIQSDTYGAARRLARAGLSPDSQVVVLGSGLNGGGEEGRLAWMLAYLGVSNVQFGAMDSVKPRLTNEPEAHPLKEAPIWKPVVQESLNATRDEVLFAINQNAFVKPASFKGAPARIYHFIDVRSERAYLGKEGIGALKHVPNMEAINVPWKQFFTADMRPNPSTSNQLRSMGCSPEDRIIILDENGIASAAVTMALRAFGFTNAANYAGGLQDLIP
jgi:3-mercaptopyruvate sulfurtransferase SseA